MVIIEINRSIWHCRWQFLSFPHVSRTIKCRCWNLCGNSSSSYTEEGCWINKFLGFLFLIKKKISCCLFVFKMSGTYQYEACPMWYICSNLKLLWYTSGFSEVLGNWFLLEYRVCIFGHVKDPVMCLCGKRRLIVSLAAFRGTYLAGDLERKSPQTHSSLLYDSLHLLNKYTELSVPHLASYGAFNKSEHNCRKLLFHNRVLKHESCILPWEKASNNY